MLEGLNLNNLSVDENGRVSFSGLSSGIDIEGTVDAIIAARRIPVDRLETTVETNKEKITALKDLRTILESLRSSLSKLYGQVSFGSAGDIFSAKQAFASSSRVDGGTASPAGNLMGVTVANSAAAGNHTFEILQTAKAHKVSSDQVADPSAALGFADGDQFTLTTDKSKTSFQSSVTAAGTDQLGSAGTLEFTDDDGDVIGTVNYLATDTIADLATNITNNVTGVTATVEAVTGGVRLRLSGTEAFRMTETGGGTVRTDFELGIKKIGVTSATSLLDLRDLINQANKGSTATGISASVVTVTNSESYLVLTATDTGTTMTLGDTSGTPLDTLGLLSAGAIKNQLQAPQMAKLYADGILDQSNLAYESDFQTSASVEVGSNGTLSFNGGALGTVNYTAATTLSQLANDITANITGVSAAVVTDGAGVRLEITGTPAFTITETGGGTAIADLGIDNKRKVIERSSNTIDDLFTGVTLSLFAAEKGTTVSLDIEQDLSQVKTEIVSFVESYNALRQFVNGQKLRDTTTGTLSEDAGVLAKSTALSTVASTLSNIIGSGVAGLDPSFTVLSQIGVNFVGLNQEDPLLAENLEIDEAVLDNVLLSNADDVRKLFGFDFTSSDPRISLLGFTGDTQFNASGYTLNVQSSATTNLALHSEEADNAYWTVTRGAISADAIAAPDASVTADGLVANPAVNTHFISTTAGESFTAGNDYIFSTYVKAGDRNNARIAFNGAAFAGSPIGADFDLVAGTVTSTDAGVSNANIEDAGNGWYRVSIKATATATGAANLERYAKDVTTSFAGDGATVSTYFWGAQLEAVAGPTVPGEYVPTTTAPATGQTVVTTANINGPADGSDDGSATVSGSVITVNSGGAKGLQLFFSGLSGVTSTQLDFTVGIGAQMFFKLGNLLDTTTGIVEGEIDQLTDQNTVHSERITEMLDRLEIQRQNLLERYIAMETALAAADRIMQSIRQTTEALTQNNN